MNEMKKANQTIPIPTVEFEPNGTLVVRASATSSERDFDFFEGEWNLHNRKLKTRLNGCTEWLEFHSTQKMYRILHGKGNIDNFLAKVDGQDYEGMSLRLFNPSTRLWSIYWADTTRGTLDPPVQGSFDGDFAHFFTKDTFEGRPILVVFRWDVRDPQNPVWSQAFSEDNGLTWEWNWYVYAHVAQVGRASQPPRNRANRTSTTSLSGGRSSTVSRALAR